MSNVGLGSGGAGGSRPPSVGSNVSGGEWVGGGKEEGSDSGREGEVGETRLGSSSVVGGKVDGASVIKGGPEEKKNNKNHFRVLMLSKKMYRS